MIEVKRVIHRLFFSIGLAWLLAWLCMVGISEIYWLFSPGGSPFNTETIPLIITVELMIYAIFSPVTTVTALIFTPIMYYLDKWKLE